ncbi:DUF362 domain-containing protein [Candidatus Aciduliprofundum boonei]|uniref:4Fe-4S ferredoxin iron-sulfur binding domain protein n=1 Tax=Aciduliprofundum boonei (strain DSM 19572 / T469) TaxID=439481 RepID=B5I9X7_ACIB4|nr:4Fe-4S binding protein [Candidatus Aciduliprofundum boonei]ADD08390.1 4Fe-4S ferredoxin iron-sulfur binding domain protein [Aciduliprofundum boonei T469]EDY37040.1 4Fe-4S binding domain protein [Aciduliprofundum boonei T469]HII55434.1 4Fe-4S binding protein [Candidatus Aciduliprofundum boonei]
MNMMNVDPAICNYCGACVGSCPVNCMFLDETIVRIDEDKCIKCGFCIRACPVGAISADWWSE